MAVERGVQQGLHKLGEAQQKRVVLQFVWGGTLYHLDDLPFMPAELPDIYTQFRKVFPTLPHHLHHQEFDDIGLT
jgi:deoxyribodipyrimidine photo-lyase